MIKKFASTLMAIAMCVSLGAVLNISATGERYATSADYVSEKVTKGTDGVYSFNKPYDYIGFKNVDLTGMKSVEITGICNMLNCDGDKVQVRIDSDKGQLLGYVDFGVHAPGTLQTFIGSLNSASGVHDLYFVSSIGYNSGSGIKSIVLSESEYVNTYEPVPDSAVIQNHASTWTFTDDLGRRAADYEEVGPVRNDKYVGMFYWTWHKGEGAPINMFEFATAHPDAKYDYKNSAWPTSGVNYFWNEPLFGYYTSTDYWVYRKHTQMLADAGVDVLFLDASNGTRTWRCQTQVLFEALQDAKRDGLNIPKIAFHSNFDKTYVDSKENIKRIYMNNYMNDMYSDLWFNWQGKPLIIANTDQLIARDGDAADTQLMNEIKNFFTFRATHASYNEEDTTGTQWSWLELYPQNGFSEKTDGSYEEASAGVAQNYSYERDYKTAMNDEYTMGRTYTYELGTDYLTGAYKYGWNFKEQIKGAIQLDPDFIYITGWNEWIAGRYETWGGVPNAFPDEYDNEGSRDLEPTKGDMKDDYYCLLVDSVRKFKGAEKLEAAGAAKTINMNDSTAWEGVTPEFINDKGTYNRDSAGYKGFNYQNDTARNNVIVSKVSRDSQYMYFYAKCAETITPATGADWMKLYINTDRNRATGFEGYDFVINGNGAGTVCTINSNNVMTTVSNAEYVLNGDTLQIKVLRSVLGLGGTQTTDELPTTGWTFDASSTNANNGVPCEVPQNVIDGNTNTIWHTMIRPKAAEPHYITIILPNEQEIGGYRYYPRTSGGTAGIASKYVIYASSDNVNFYKVAAGSWAIDRTAKSVYFPTNVRAKAIKLEIVNGSGGYGSAGELRLLRGPLDFEFKWADNAGTSGDILDFYSNGNCAPMGRFNYRYTEKEQTSISEGNRTNLFGTTIVKEGSNRGIASGAKIFVYEPDLRYTAKRINGVMYIPAALCEDALGLRVEWNASKQMLKLRSAETAIRIVAGSYELRINGVYNVAVNTVTILDGIPYVPVTLLSQSMNLNIYNNGNICAFGENIDTATVDAVSNQI